MKKVILLLCSIMLSAGVAFADSCFIAKENGKVLTTLRQRRLEPSLF